MKSLSFIILIFSAVTVSGQINPVDFEAGGNGADWTWTVFENDTNPALEIVANPDGSGINGSNTVAKFTALQTGAPFAGCETMHGSDIGTFTLDANNAFVSIMVYKEVISDIGIKLVTPPGGSTGEIKLPNSAVNQWERIVIDFTSVIGIPETIGIDQLVVFPDFNARTSDRVIYFDNIEFGDASLAVEAQNLVQVKAFPNPTNHMLNVTSQEVVQRAELYNTLGQLMLTHEPKSERFTFNLLGYKAGVYFLKLFGNGSEQVLRVVIQ